MKINKEELAAKIWSLLRDQDYVSPYEEGQYTLIDGNFDLEELSAGILDILA